MKRLLFSALLGVLMVLGTGCDLSDEEGGTVTLTGQVLDQESENPISGAFVRIFIPDAPPGEEEVMAETDNEGRFSADVEIDATVDLEVRAFKDGFSVDQVIVTAVAGREIDVPTFRLFQTREEELESGTPSNILLLEQSAQDLRVIESGGLEVARLTFQVADSAGNPVTLDNKALVRFSFGKHPGGGEFLAPAEAETDNQGRVTVNLSSGTTAGVVQVLAESDVEGETIRSRPVPITIHGGLPDQAHFSLGPEQFNFPGLTRYGLTDAISVIVGDKFGNPVKEGTAVYFTTDGGVIEGSINTDDQGRGSVQLISANPLPPRGVAVVTAETADENQERVSSRTPVLFSGVTTVSVTPTTAILGQTYALTVQDPNGNPLAPGTRITVRAEGTKVKAVGNVGVTLDDTGFLDQNGDGDGLDYEDVIRGPGITEFTFRAVDDLRIDESGTPTLESITITVNSPNGGVEIVLTAGGEVMTRTAQDEEAVVERLPDDTALVRLAE